MTKTVTIDGVKVRTGSTRRFVVLCFHAGRYRVEARSDSFATIKARAGKLVRWYAGGHVRIWDTATGEIMDWAGRPV